MNRTGAPQLVASGGTAGGTAGGTWGFLLEIYKFTIIEKKNIANCTVHMLMNISIIEYI